jgi:hypothetical protein
VRWAVVPYGTPPSAQQDDYLPDAGVKYPAKDDTQQAKFNPRINIVNIVLRKIYLNGYESFQQQAEFFFKPCFDTFMTF